MAENPRLQAIRENQEAASKYREALAILQELHIFDVLREDISSSLVMHTGAEFGKDVDLAIYYKLCGYKECIHDLETLLNTSTGVVNKVPLDFGARESLREQGYTEAEILKILGEE